MGLVSEINYFYYRMALQELQILNHDDYYNGLSYNSMLYTNVIAQMRNCTISAIAQALHVTKSAVTLKINELVKQGAVVRVRSETDKRVVYVKLSPQMEKTISIYDTMFEKIERDLKTQYAEEQLALFEEILHKISGYEWRKIQNG